MASFLFPFGGTGKSGRGGVEGVVRWEGGGVAFFINTHKDMKAE